MHRKILTLLTILVVISLPTASAFAGRVHFTGSVDFTIHSPLTASGTLAGLGNGDIFVILEAWGTGTAMCSNKGGNEAPGQNPVTVNVMGIQGISAKLIENGTTPFSVTTDDPKPPTAKEAGCPNNNWKVTSFFVYWTSAAITVKDAGTGASLLHQEFDCITTSPPNASVTCTPRS